jgi:hypothetical protein
VLDSLVKLGTIDVEATQSPSAVFELVIDAYGVEEGDKAVPKLCRQEDQYAFVVVDDRLLYIVLHRFAMRPLFLPDLIVMMWEQNAVSVKLAEEMLDAIKSRYRQGFIEHSIQKLKGAI